MPKYLYTCRLVVYMLYDLKPELVTGGAWDSEQDFDYDFCGSLECQLPQISKPKGMCT